MGERRLGQVHGNVLDSADVEGDVLAGGAVAARRRANKRAVAVRDGHTQAVDLKFAGVGDLARAERVLGALQPFVKLLEVHGVVHGVHARHVGDGRELLGHEAAHALSVGVGRDELGVRGLDQLELDQNTVEHRDGDHGGDQGVVAVGMVIEQMAQLCRTGSATVDQALLLLRHNISLAIG